MSATAVGRSGEMGRLLAFAQRAFSGSGVAVVLEGKPGVGKSLMLDALADTSRRLGARVHHGRADELEQRLPFAAIGSCFGVGPAKRAADVDHLAAMPRDRQGRRHPSVAAADRDFVVTEALVDLVDGWCSSAPVALLLDDLQWADEPSLLVLHRLGAVLGQIPLLVVAALRPQPRSTELDGLLRSLSVWGAQSLVLGPLSDEAVEQLVERLVNAKPTPRLMDVLSAAAGNPLHVTEWVAALRDDHRIAVTDDMVDLAGSAGVDAGVSDTPAEAISRRLEVGSGQARKALRVAALLGSGFDAAELSAVLNIPTSDLWEVLAEAVARWGVHERLPGWRHAGRVPRCGAEARQGSIASDRDREAGECHGRAGTGAAADRG